MIEIEIHKKRKQYRGFLCSGHAGYAQEGYDIICSAVSALTINAVNSIEQFTEDAFAVRQDDGFLELILEGDASSKTALLLDSMVLGLQEIQKQYGNEYIRLIFREV